MSPKVTTIDFEILQLLLIRFLLGFAVYPINIDQKGSVTSLCVTYITGKVENDMHIVLSREMAA